MGDGNTTGISKGIHHLQYRTTLAAAQVEAEQLGCFRQQHIKGGLVAGG